MSTDANVLASRIASTLGEHEVGALITIKNIVVTLGEARALELLKQAQAEAGQMMTDDGARLRTPGGVFFKLAKGSVTKREFWKIFAYRDGAAVSQTAPPPTWAECEALARDVLAKRGEATTVKITLTGRPLRIIEKQDVVLTSFESRKIPTLPKGLPAPPAEPTTYVAYIARKQWNKVKEAINNPQDSLIIEGYPVMDPRLKAVAVLVTNVTTKLLQQAKREAQRQAEPA
jgi:hypothetical protein